MKRLQSTAPESLFIVILTWLHEPRHERNPSTIVNPRLPEAFVGLQRSENFDLDLRETLPNYSMSRYSRRLPSHILGSLTIYPNEERGRNGSGIARLGMHPIEFIRHGYMRLFRHWFGSVKYNVVFRSCPIDPYPSAAKWLLDRRLLDIHLARFIASENGDTALLFLISPKDSRTTDAEGYMDICYRYRHYDIIEQMIKSGYAGYNNASIGDVAENGTPHLMEMIMSTNSYIDRDWIARRAVRGANTAILAWLATLEGTKWEMIDYAVQVSLEIQDWWQRWKNHHRDEKNRIKHLKKMKRRGKVNNITDTKTLSCP